MRQFRVFTWDRVLIYGGLCALFTGLILWALASKHFALPPQGYIVYGVVLSTVYAIVWVYFRTRVLFKRSIAGYTSQGTAVRPGSLTPRLPLGWQRQIDDTIESAIQFWACRNSTKAKQIRAAFVGSYVNFEPNKLEFKDLQGFTRFAVGLQCDKYLIITWSTDMPWRTALNIIRHEAGHLAMSAAAIPAGDLGDNHHTIMANEQYGA